MLRQPQHVRPQQQRNHIRDRLADGRPGGDCRAGLEPAYLPLRAGSSPNLALGATAVASNVYQNSGDYNANKAIDGSALTRWATDIGEVTSTLTVTFPEPVSVSSVVLREAKNYESHLQEFRLEYWDGGQWLTLVVDIFPGLSQRERFPAVTTTKLRLNITSSGNGPSIQELEVYDDEPAITVDDTDTGVTYSGGPGPRSSMSAIMPVRSISPRPMVIR